MPRNGKLRPGPGWVLAAVIAVGCAPPEAATDKVGEGAAPAGSGPPTALEADHFVPSSSGEHELGLVSDRQGTRPPGPPRGDRTDGYPHPQRRGPG